MSLILAFITILGGCSLTPKVHYDSKPEFKFEGFHKYFILQTEKEENHYLSLDQNRTIRAINDILKQKGYQNSTKSDSDFIVSFQLMNEKKYRSDNTHDAFFLSPYWYSYGFGYSNYVREYTVNTLIIDIIDPHSREVVWRGSTGSRLKSNLNPEEKSQRIRKATENILKVLP